MITSPAYKIILRLAAGGLGACLALVTNFSWAVPYNNTINGKRWFDYPAPPLTTVSTVSPLVMLTLSRDHQLHYKAYNDYSDLNGDGALETTYSGSLDYYGYFDPKKCYDYVTTDGGRFDPADLASISATNQKSCVSKWSGNFLNWAAMTRMDAESSFTAAGAQPVSTPAL